MDCKPSATKDSSTIAVNIFNMTNTSTCNQASHQHAHRVRPGEQSVTTNENTKNSLETTPGTTTRHGQHQIESGPDSPHSLPTVYRISFQLFDLNEASSSVLIWHLAHIRIWNMAIIECSISSASPQPSRRYEINAIVQAHQNWSSSGRRARWLCWSLAASAWNWTWHGHRVSTRCMNQYANKYLSTASPNKDALTANRYNRQNSNPPVYRNNPRVR